MNIPKLIISLTLCYFVAFAGSLVTLPSISTWYETLNKPLFSPPNFIFGPVWTILYTFIGVSMYIVWSKKVMNKKIISALKIFVLQLILNFLWSLVFFGYHLLELALITIIILWIAVFSTIIAFKKVSKTAAYILIPYIVWVSFFKCNNC